MRPRVTQNERTTDDASETLFHPHGKGLHGVHAHPGWSLSPELRRQITRRLRLIAITYSLVFFFADIVPSATFGEFMQRWHEPLRWVPTVGSILMGLMVAWLAGSSRLSWHVKENLGLVFQVVGSYGIALSQYVLEPEVRVEPDLLMVLSPSWVAIWMLFYSMSVPAPPRKMLVALLASASAPPVVIWVSLHAAKLQDLLPPWMFVVHHVLPYLICTAMAYVGARVVYNLGADVSRAHDLGSYRLIERLGQGGMGEVWRASHEFLARPAAIKFIRPEALGGVDAEGAKLLRRRFELEARSTASLTSAHTVDIYDFGVTDDGRFYYVMELLDGLDCDELVRRYGAITPARAIHLLAQICESLDEAHSRGLIHRDVKPANVYVCRNGNRFDFVKVLDFGLVAHRGMPDASDVRLTQPHQAIGTPQFMPPEVALGKETDGRTDLYALGCVAYWLLGGRPVFTGENLYDVLSKHLRERPDPPSRHAPHALHPALDAVILACLEKEPDRRPGSARQLAQTLRSVPLDERWGDDEAEAWWDQAKLSHPRPAGAPS